MTLPATDSFTRANGALGSDWAGSVGSDLAISSNEVTGASATDSAMYWTTDTPNNDQRAKCTLKSISAGQYAGPFVRGSATDFVILVAQSDTDYEIQWYNGGAWTQIGSTYAVAPANGDVLEIRVEGTTYKGYINGVERISGSNGSAPASGNGGLYVYSNSARVDDFEVDNLATLEQEGFRFGVDDGNEASHTWEAAQDTNITTAAAVTKLLRMLANATGDPSAIAYKLKYQKNGSGGYTTVPLTATSIVKPVIEAGDCTVSGNNTAEATWAVSHPAANTGDLLIFYIAWDDSTATTGVTAPSGANGETLTAINSTPVTDASTETRAKAWYCVATGSWTATTKTFTPSATESWSATVVRIPAGEFDAATPIGATSTSAATGTADTNVVSPAYSAGASDGGGVLLWFAGVDTDPLSATNPTGWTILQRQDLGAVAHGVAVRDAEVSDSESISSANWGIAGDSWTSIAVIVRGPTVTNDLYISTSANITAGGEATTARLTAPSGKTTSDFVTGRRWDNENGTDTIDITTDNYTEVEWCITLKSGLSGGDYFDFRVYNSDTALDTYTVTPRWTISSGTSLTVQDATHTHAADAIALTASNYLAVTDATHTHAADAIALTASNHLAVTDATHVHAVDAIALTVSASLSVTDATHTHAADAIGLTTDSHLAVTDAAHEHASDAIALTANSSLAVDDATHTHSADAITLTLSVSLVVQGAAHTHAADAITLSVGISLVVSDATHEHSSDAIALTASNYLAVTDATHEHAADAITLTASAYLAVTDATHTHSADAITLVSDSHLAVQDATHEHATDGITLGVNGSTTLTVVDATHEHAADAITLTANVYLAVTDAAHEHAADAITLGLSYSLTVQDATHLHACDAVTLTANSYLVVQDATHVHTVDAITLVAGIFMGVATLTTSLVDVAELSDASLWIAGLSDSAQDLAVLNDGSIWTATLNDQARESAEVDDEPL